MNGNNNFFFKEGLLSNSVMNILKVNNSCLIRLMNCLKEVIVICIVNLVKIL